MILIFKNNFRFPLPTHQHRTLVLRGYLPPQYLPRNGMPRTEQLQMTPPTFSITIDGVSARRLPSLCSAALQDTSSHRPAHTPRFSTVKCFSSDTLLLSRSPNLWVSIITRSISCRSRAPQSRSAYLGEQLASRTALSNTFSVDCLCSLFSHYSYSPSLFDRFSSGDNYIPLRYSLPTFSSKFFTRT